MTNKFSAILFDLDGTLLDTAPDLADSLNILLEEYQKPPLPINLIRPWAGRGSKGLLELGFGVCEPENFKFLQKRYLEIYLENVSKKTIFYPGFDRVLYALQERNYVWGIVTNKPLFLTQPLLSSMKFSPTPHCIVSGDMCAKPKPAPDPLFFACEMLGVEPTECLFVGDCEYDAVAAQKAGMTMILARYGYFLQEDHPEQWPTHGEIHQPEELLAWL